MQVPHFNAKIIPVHHGYFILLVASGKSEQNPVWANFSSPSLASLCNPFSSGSREQVDFGNHGNQHKHIYSTVCLHKIFQVDVDVQICAKLMQRS